MAVLIFAGINFSKNQEIGLTKMTAFLLKRLLMQILATFSGSFIINLPKNPLLVLLTKSPFVLIGPGLTTLIKTLVFLSS